MQKRAGIYNHFILWTFTLLLAFNSLIASESPLAPDANSFISPVNGSLIIVGYVTATDEYRNAHDVALLDDSYFTKMGKSPTFGFDAETQWMKIRVFNFDNQTARQILEVNNPVLNICNLYEIKGNTSSALFRSGDEIKFGERTVSHLNHLFPVDIAPFSSREFLLEVAARGEQFQVPVKLWTPAELVERDEKDRLLRGIYFGIILFVLLFNSFIYIIIREKSSLWYVAYVFMLLMLQLSLSGFAFQYFWPNSVYLANVANPFFASFSILALIRFTQHFLNLQFHFPKLNKAFHAIAFLVATNILLSLVYTPLTFRVSVLAINSLALLLNVLILPTVWLVMRKGFKPARFFLFAFIALVLTVFFFILNNFGVISSEFYGAYGLQIGSALEVVLLSFAVVDKFKSFRDEAYDRLLTINNLKARANEVLELKVQERTEEISQQKQVVERQKEEIVDSIRYAERIQKSLIPDEKALDAAFAENFVIFRPRDIVSGDFYWFGKTTPENSWSGKSGHHLFAAVDCTGHGVPGAMMSMLGFNALDRALESPFVNSPADMLNFVNNEILRAIREKREQGLQDGMDMVLCAYDRKTKTLQFAGAKNNVYILRNSLFIEVKGDRFPIGQEFPVNGFTGFTNHSVKLAPGDTIYAFTDGFPDQFGGEHNKKLKSKPLLEIISTFADKKMAEQKELLLGAFDGWKGENEQTDDVCMLGIKV